MTIENNKFVILHTHNQRYYYVHPIYRVCGDKSMAWHENGVPCTFKKENGDIMSWYYDGKISYSQVDGISTWFKKNGDKFIQLGKNHKYAI